MRAQVAVEYLVITAMLLAFLAGIYIYVQSTSSDTLRIEQAKDAVRSIAAAADRISGIGPKTKTFVTVTIPDGSTNLLITGKAVQVTVPTSAGSTDVFEIASVNLTANETIGPGTHQIVLEVASDGSVVVSKA